MKYKRWLRCIKDYEEDLTGNDDTLHYWTLNLSECSGNII